MPSTHCTAQALLAFANALPNAEHLYLLLDPLAGGPAEGALSALHLAASLGAARVRTVPRQALAHSPVHQPVLCQLAGPGQRLAETELGASAERSEAEQNASARHVCGWLHSQAPIAEVAGLLARQADALPELGGAPLPWYQPLRLELLAETLGEGLGGVLGPVQGWWAPTSWGTLARWAGAGVATATQCDRAEQAQAQVALIQRLLGLWRAAMPLPQHAASQALEMILAGRALGLQSDDDLLSLSLYRACTHPLLHTHPQIQRHIDEAARGLAPLPAALCGYSREQWQQLVGELGAGHPQVNRTPPKAGAAPGRMG